MGLSVTVDFSVEDLTPDHPGNCTSSRALVLSEAPPLLCPPSPRGTRSPPFLLYLVLHSLTMKVGIVEIVVSMVNDSWMLDGP